MYVDDVIGDQWPDDTVDVMLVDEYATWQRWTADARLPWAVALYPIRLAVTAAAAREQVIYQIAGNAWGLPAVSAQKVATILDVHRVASDSGVIDGVGRDPVRPVRIRSFGERYRARDGVYLTHHPSGDDLEKPYWAIGICGGAPWQSQTLEIAYTRRPDPHFFTTGDSGVPQDVPREYRPLLAIGAAMTLLAPVNREVPVLLANKYVEGVQSYRTYLGTRRHATAARSIT